MRTLSFKILASLGALAAIGVLAIGGTYANFSATPTTISSNAFTTGTLSMSRSGSGAVLAASALKIGQESTGSVTISNTGSLAGIYSLGGSTTGSSALAGALKLVVYKETDNDTTSKLYDGALSGLSSVSLGTFAPAGASGDAHTFYFHVSLPSTGSDAGDNLLQGTTASASFTWSAVQA
jgi:predicted ribosomally synthesized peptide with SipW-like signal peptide